MSKTKIICTLGPASKDEAVLRQLIQFGMSIARLNFSHGNHKSHKHYIDSVRKLNESESAAVKILQDLEGYRIRVGLFSGPRKKITLERGSTVTLVNQVQTDQQNVIPFDYDGSMADMQPGCDIFIDDGNLALKVIAVEECGIKAEVVVGGVLKENKGINIPEVDLKFEGLTDKDKGDLLFGIENKVDLIAQSFVQTAEDITSVRQFINRRDYDCHIIAKIENRRGIEHIDEIMEVADGIMVARGDMGVSLPIYEVPIVQKMLIKKCSTDETYVITATQMLESMTENVRPTRAEVSDVANAIIDGSDYVMLSGETAAGKHPVEAVQIMAAIIDYTEKSLAAN